MDYDALLAALGALLPVPVTETNFVNILPRAIDAAEGRIYKDMDFLTTEQPDTTKSFTPGQRTVDIPDRMIAVLGVSWYNATTLRYTPLRDIDVNVLDLYWPQRFTTTSEPQYWAREGTETVIIGGTPALASQVEFRGLMRPEPMSSTNKTTYIGDNHAELMLDACMVFFAGYQKNYGAQSDDPRMAVSWEQRYQADLQSSMAQEKRIKGMGQGS